MSPSSAPTTLVAIPTNSPSHHKNVVVTSGGTVTAASVPLPTGRVTILPNPATSPSHVALLAAIRALGRDEDAEAVDAYLTSMGAPDAVTQTAVLGQLASTPNALSYGLFTYQPGNTAYAMASFAVAAAVDLAPGDADSVASNYTALSPSDCSTAAWRACVSPDTSTFNASQVGCWPPVAQYDLSIPWSFSAASCASGSGPETAFFAAALASDTVTSTSPVSYTGTPLTPPAQALGALSAVTCDGASILQPPENGNLVPAGFVDVAQAVAGACIAFEVVLCVRAVTLRDETIGKPAARVTGFAVAFAPTLSRLYKLHAILHNARLSKIKVADAADAVEFQLVVYVTLLVGMVAWTAVDPLTWRRDVLTTDPATGLPTSSVGAGANDDLTPYVVSVAGYVGACILVGLYIAYVNREATRFAQVRSLATTVAALAEALVLSVPVLILVGGYPAASYGVKVVFIFVTAGFTTTAFASPMLAKRLWWWSGSGSGSRSGSAGASKGRPKAPSSPTLMGMVSSKRGHGGGGGATAGGGDVHDGDHGNDTSHHVRDSGADADAGGSTALGVWTRVHATVRGAAAKTTKPMTKTAKATATGHVPHSSEPGSPTHDDEMGRTTGVVGRAKTTAVHVTDDDAASSRGSGALHVSVGALHHVDWSRAGPSKAPGTSGSLVASPVPASPGETGKEYSATLADVLGDAAARAAFEAHLNREHAAETIRFWADVEAFKRSFHDWTPSTQRARAARIVHAYVDLDGEFTVNLSADTRNELMAAVAAPRGTTTATTSGVDVLVDDPISDRMFDRARDDVMRLMENDALMRFRATPEYASVCERLAQARGGGAAPPPAR